MEERGGEGREGDGDERGTGLPRLLHCPSRPPLEHLCSNRSLEGTSKLLYTAFAPVLRPPTTAGSHPGAQTGISRLCAGMLRPMQVRDEGLAKAIEPSNIGHKLLKAMG